jgi:hypothetical protein
MLTGEHAGRHQSQLYKGHDLPLRDKTMTWHVGEGKKSIYSTHMAWVKCQYMKVGTKYMES